MRKNMSMLITFVVISFYLVASPSDTYAGLLFHAASRRAAQGIFKSGFNKGFMHRQSRFGSGAYLSKGRHTALSERPGAQSIVSFKTGKGFDRKVLDTRSMPTKEMKTQFHIKDMRGAVKKDVIGPKAGRKIGAYASRNNKNVAFRSAKDPEGTNLFIPKETYSRSSRMMTPVKITNVTH